MLMELSSSQPDELSSHSSVCVHLCICVCVCEYAYVLHWGAERNQERRHVNAPQPTSIPPTHFTHMY